MTSRTYMCDRCGAYKLRPAGSTTSTCRQCTKKTPGPPGTATYFCQGCGKERAWHTTRNPQRPRYCRECSNLPVHRGEPDVDWIESANCRSVDPELFYDLSPTGHYKKICDACPVIRQCLTAAHKYRDCHAIWGGLAPKQRKRLADDGAGPTNDTADVTRCGNCGGWKEPHLFCWTCHQAALRKRDLA